jgi:hypothetical protein
MQVLVASVPRVQARKELRAQMLAVNAPPVRAEAKEMSALGKSALRARSGSLVKRAPRESVRPAQLGLAARRGLRESAVPVRNGSLAKTGARNSGRPIRTRRSNQPVVPG